jgi:hypothetical protein
MRIKILLLSSIVALIAFASCKKNTTTTITKVDSVLYLDSTIHASLSDSISADVDGLLFAADSGAYLEFDKDSYYTNGVPFNEFDFQSYDSKGDDYYIWLGTSANNFTPKTYGAFGDSTTYAGVEFDSTGGGYYYSSTVLNPATVTITSVSGTTVKGTFSGTIYRYGDSTQTGSNKKIITNGKFNLVY